MARKEDQVPAEVETDEGSDIKRQADDVLSGAVYGQDAPAEDAQEKADADRASKSTDASTPAKATKSADAKK